MATYHWNSDLTWEHYLRANSFVKDITGTIHKDGEETRRVLSAKAQQIVASNEALSRTFQQGFDQVSGTLRDGFGMVSEQLKTVSQGIETLGAAFEYGMGLLLEQSAAQSQLLRNVLNKLDGIHHTLQTPTLTQAREFYNLGRDRLSKGLLDKSLEAFLQAEAKNDTDFLTQFALGHLYLYGLNEDCVVLDIVKAEQHLRNAARYAKPEISQLPEARKYCGEAYMHASIACYAQAHEHKQSGDQTVVQKLLQDAAKLATQATDVYPQLSEGFYQHAKVQALLGDAPLALTSLAQAIKKDRNYCLKADTDHDFDVIRPQVLEVFEQLRIQAQSDAKPILDEARQLLNEHIFLSDEAKKLQHDMTALLQKEALLFPNGTYFDYLDTMIFISEMQTRLNLLNLPINFITTLNGSSKSVRSVAFSPNGCYLASGGGDGKVCLWEISSGKLITTLDGYAGAYVAFSPDGRYLVSGGLQVRVCDLEGLPTFWKNPNSRQSQFERNRVYSGGTYRTTLKLYLWEIPSGKLITMLDGNLQNVSIAFSPDGRYLASDGIKEVCLWEIPSGKKITTLDGHLDYVRSVAFSPDGCYLASGGDDGKVCLWEIPSGKLITTLDGHAAGRSDRCVAFSPDGRYLAAGKDDGKVCLWEIPSGKLITTLDGYSPYKDVSSVAFSPDGHCLASLDKKLRLWEIPSGKSIATLEDEETGYHRNHYPVAFSPDGRCLVSSAKKLRLWEIPSGKMITTLDERTDNYSVAFSPDGCYLASGNKDGAIRIWETPIKKKGQQQTIEQERYHREQEPIHQRSEQLRDDRLRQGLCISCGSALSFFAKLGGQTICKKCR